MDIKDEVCVLESSVHQEAPVPIRSDFPMDYVLLREKLQQTTLPGNFEAHRKSSQIRLNDYQTCGPDLMIRTSVVITPSFETKIRVHQTDLPPDHELWQGTQRQTHTVESVVGLLHRITTYKVCEGNTDSKSMALFSTAGASTAALAYRETNKMCDTLRSVRCELLLKDGLCNVCSGYRGLLRKAIDKSQGPITKLTPSPPGLISHGQPATSVTNRPHETLISAHSSDTEPTLNFNQIGSSSLNAAFQFDLVKQEMEDIHSGSESIDAFPLENMVDEPSDQAMLSSRPPPGSSTHSQNIPPIFNDDKTTETSEQEELKDNVSDEGQSTVCNKSQLIGSVYPCDLCDKQFLNQTLLELHVEKHRKKYKCYLCDNKFRRKCDLYNHQKSHDDNKQDKSLTRERPYKATVCGTGFFSKRIQMKGAYKQNHYPCDVCGAVFQVKKSLHSHITRKHGQLDKCDCDVCGEECLGRYALIVHKYSHSGEKPYNCSVCGKGFFRKNTLKQHELIHTQQTPVRGEYKCDVCGAVFLVKKSLYSHKQRKHGPSWKVQCDLCGVECKGTVALNVHKQKHTGIKPFMCATCGKTFFAQPLLRQHETIHERETQSTEYPCSICGEVFLVKKSMYSHKSRKHGPIGENVKCEVCGKECPGTHALNVHKHTHTGVKPYMCAVCGKGFFTKPVLKQHEAIHTRETQGPTRYPCSICGEVFLVKKSLYSHRARKHAKVKTIKCEICGEDCLGEHALNVHRHKHTGEKPFICSVCGKGFFTKPILKQHETTHTRDADGKTEHRCDICGEVFFVKKSLYSHKARKHGSPDRVKPPKSKSHTRLHTTQNAYLCAICGKSFKSRSGYYDHKRAHTGEKPYKCTICGKGLQRKRNLAKHLLGHTREKSCQCDVCGKVFAKPLSLRSHQTIHGPKKPSKSSVCD